MKDFKPLNGYVVVEIVNETKRGDIHLPIKMKDPLSRRAKVIAIPPIPGKSNTIALVPGDIVLLPTHGGMLLEKEGDRIYSMVQYDEIIAKLEKDDPADIARAKLKVLK